MRHIGLQKSSQESNLIVKGLQNEIENKNLSEKINTNLLMIFYHPLFQETTKKFLSLIFKKQPHKIQIKFLQFIELNLRIQKVLTEQFSIKKAVDSALNDWSREMSELIEKEHQFSNQNPFEIRYHYESMKELNIQPSLPISSYSKLFEKLQDHSAFNYCQYSGSIEVIQKFLFDMCCNWCQFYDIELFCIFVNAIFLSITQGTSLNECSTKQLNQIQYISTPFFKEFNQAKQVYSRYIKKNLKDNFKVWCEWNFQRLNDICQSLVQRLSRIFQNDTRITDFPELFKQALDNFNKEIIYSTIEAQKIIENDQTEKNQQNSIEMIQIQKNINPKIKVLKKQKSSKVVINEQEYNDKIQNQNSELKKENISLNENLQGQNSRRENDNKIQDHRKQQDKKHFLNEIQSEIIEKKLKQMSKLIEKQKDEIEEDSHQLKLAYRLSQKCSANAYKYFQKLLHSKKEQQKKLVQNIQIPKTTLAQEFSSQRDEQKQRFQDVNSNQIIDEFFISNQTRLNTENIKNNIEEPKVDCRNYQFQQYSNLNQSSYENKKGFLLNTPKRKQSNRISLNQSLISPSQVTLENQRNTQDSAVRNIQTCIQNSMNNGSEILQSSEKLQKNNSSIDVLNEKPLLDLHQIALTKAHQISPAKKNESIYDNSPLLPKTKKTLLNMNSLRGHTHSQQQQQDNKLIQFNKLQTMPLISLKINNLQIQNEKDKEQNMKSLSAKYCFTNIDKIQYNEQYKINRIATTKTESDSPTYQPIQQTYNERFHTEQDYILNNTNNEQKQIQNSFHQIQKYQSNKKKNTSLGDIINLNYLYRPETTFSDEFFQNKKQNESSNLSLDSKQLKTEIIQFSGSNQHSQRKNSIGIKIRSQTLGLNDIYPQSLKGNQYNTINYKIITTNKQTGEQSNNFHLLMKQVQPQYTQRYRKLVSQSRNLWQKYLVEEELYQLNDFDKLNNLLDQLRKTKNIDQTKQIIQKYLRLNDQQQSESDIFQFKLPHNRKAEIPLMQGKNMKINEKI